MRDYNQEYFYLVSSGLGDYPLLDYAPNGGNYNEIFRPKPVDTGEKRILRFSPPIPSKPQFGDYHYLAVHAPVISERLKKVLEALNIEEVQFLPTVILDKTDNEHEGYYILHTYKEIRCLDKAKSKWEKGDFDEESTSEIDKLVLDNEILDTIPLEKRLMFGLWENRTYLVFHQSVIEKILEISPTGIRVYPISEYDDSLPFIDTYKEYFGK